MGAIHTIHTCPPRNLFWIVEERYAYCNFQEEIYVVVIHFPPGMFEILRDGTYNSLYFSTNWKYQPLQFDYNSNVVGFVNSG